MKKFSLILLYMFILLGVCGCDKEENIETPQPKINYVDVTTNNISDFINIENYISTAMPNCYDFPDLSCRDGGFHKLYQITSKYNNINFENVNISLDYELVCFNDSSYSDTTKIVTHLDDIVLNGNERLLFSTDGSVQRFSNNQYCYDEQSDKIVVTNANGKIKITENIDNQN